MRLIDADALKTKKVRCEERREWVVPVAEIDWMPTIEPKRGKWLYKSGSRWEKTWECSECGEETTSAIMGKPRYNYCPICGADMKGEERA